MRQVQQGGGGVAGGSVLQTTLNKPSTMGIYIRALDRTGNLTDLHLNWVFGVHSFLSEHEGC